MRKEEEEEEKEEEGKDRSRRRRRRRMRKEEGEPANCSVGSPRQLQPGAPQLHRKKESPPFNIYFSAGLLHKNPFLFFSGGLGLTNERPGN